MITETSTAPFASGFVSILGRPNVGKSTLMNALIGTKIAIVADKPQTTRTGVQGVLTIEEGQIVFLDTPGIHKARSRLNKRMMDSVREALDQRDLLVYVADAAAPFTTADREALDLVKKSETPVFLVLNKIDLLRDKTALLPLIERYRAAHSFAECFPVSARKQQGLDELRAAILARLPQGPAYFPSDHITDQPERFLAAELIREKIIRETREEVPHSVAVIVDRWDEQPEITRILATIYVEKEGQKGILIGAKGAMLKTVGTRAREEMEQLFGKKIFLELHVRAQHNWRENKAFLNSLDWRTMAGTDES
jgi:GTP-binding protein Era